MKKRFKLPAVTRPEETRCIPVQVPDHPDYIRALVTALEATVLLDRFWERDNAKTALQVREEWRERTYVPLLETISNFGQCAEGEISEGECIEYFATDRLFNYLPAPPNVTPPNYSTPAHVIYNVDLSILDELVDRFGLNLSGVVGFQPGDVITTLLNFPTVPYSGINPIDWIGQWVAHVQSVITNGMPRVSFEVTGSGVIELHMVAVPLGGYALVGVDIAENPVDFALDLITGSIGIADVNSLIELNRDVFAIPPERGGEIIHEIKIEDDGLHTVDIIYIPKFDDSVSGFVGYGGGLRSVVLCGFEPVYGTNEGNNMPFKFRMNSDCIFEYRLENPDGTVYQDWTEVEGMRANGITCFKGDPGPPGPPGAPGSTVTVGQGGQIIIDNNGDGIPDQIYQPPSGTPNQVSAPSNQTDSERCNSAYYIATQVIDLATRTVEDATNISLAEFLQALFGVGGFDSSLLNQLWDFVVSNVSGLQSINLYTHRQRLTEELYCNDLSRSAVDLTDISQPAQGAIMGALNAVTAEKFNLWAIVGQSKSSPIDCSTFGCGEGCDAPYMLGGAGLPASVTVLEGSYSAGVDTLTAQVNSSGSSKSLVFEIGFGQQVEITKVRWLADVQQSGGTRRVRWGTGDAYPNEDSLFVNAITTSTSGVESASWTGAITASKIGLNAAVVNSSSNYYVLHCVEIEFTVI